MLNLIALIIWSVLGIVLLIGARTRHIYKQCCKEAEQIINEELMEKP